MPVLLAHGELGPFDEILFFSVAFIFFVMMGISWIKSRYSPPEDPASTGDQENPSHFTLD